MDIVNSSNSNGKVKDIPTRLKTLLVASILGVVILGFTTFLIYVSTRNVAKTVGIDSTPSIVAAQNIKSLLADTHSNAMNAMLTGEKASIKNGYWDMYRISMSNLQSQLLDSSKNITLGEAERKPLLDILANVNKYEYTVGGAVSDGAKISVDQFMEANRLMQQNILPASMELDNVNVDKLNLVYDAYAKNINMDKFMLFLVGAIVLVLLGFTQIYLYSKTHRLLNLGLCVSSILVIVFVFFTNSALKSVKTNLDIAKNDAFTSIHALWSTKAVAYNTKALESLYLMHDGTGIVQTADTINFKLATSKILDDEGKGYLAEGLKSKASVDQDNLAKSAMDSWKAYVSLDNTIRTLEYDSKHMDAIAFTIGTKENQSANAFEKFDKTLGQLISVNQVIFDKHIESAFKTLNILPYTLSIFIIGILIACIVGMKPRIDEYKF